MSLVGKIQSLFLDREKTQPIFPITKVKAVSDDNGKGLNVLLDDKASKDFVTAKIAEAQLGGSGGEIDLSGFATKDDLNSVNDKIPTTPEQIGAHPNTWMPTASDVGATPASHSTDQNNPHGVTPAQIGAAPAGYGLGGYTKLLDSTTDINNIKSFGVYDWGGSKPINAPSNYMIMVPIFKNANDGVQYFHKVTLSGVYEMAGRRVMSSGTWGEFEWFNPPMVLGVEYRTTERWNGKAVYTKLIDFGAMPNATLKIVQHNIQNIDYTLSASVTAKSDSWMFTVPASYSKDTDVTFSKTELIIQTTVDRSQYNAYFAVKYTKV